MARCVRVRSYYILYFIIIIIIVLLIYCIYCVFERAEVVFIRFVRYSTIWERVSTLYRSRVYMSCHSQEPLQWQSKYKARENEASERKKKRRRYTRELREFGRETEKSVWS